MVEDRSIFWLVIHVGLVFVVSVDIYVDIHSMYSNLQYNKPAHSKIDVQSH